MRDEDDFKLLRGFDDGQTDRQTDEQTFVNVKSLSRLKNRISSQSIQPFNFILLARSHAERENYYQPTHTPDSFKS